MIGFQIKRTLLLGLKSLWLHRLRSLLTILGMILGVCSVVAMLAIGEGASYEAQEQIKALGSTNIIIRSVKPPETQALESTSRLNIPSYGVKYADAERIATTLPGVEVTVPARTLPRKKARHRGRDVDAVLTGTVPWFPEIMRREVAAGRFLCSMDMYSQSNVCVLEPEVAAKLFPMDDPLGQLVRVEEQIFTVVGVMKAAAHTVSGSAGRSGGEGARPAGEAIYVPLTTIRLRYGAISLERRAGTFIAEQVELHQIAVRVHDADQVLNTAEALRAILKQTHPNQDYEMIVPLELLARANELKRKFAFVLGAIAGISLLVGGIGIMNIMLATVTERTREIGIRRALGAKRRHIVIQFLTETVVLSGAGGIIGLVLGVIIPILVQHFAAMKTIITVWSLLLALGISIAVGLLFGIYPAYRAANMNPIEALRHE